MLVQVVHIPTLASPVDTVFARVDGEPVRICGLVELDIFDEGLNFLQSNRLLQAGPTRVESA